MKSIVLYSTQSGNTEKVAREIASELKCPCTKISSNLSLNLNGYDMVFIGTGIYKGQPHPDVLNYLSKVNLKGSRSFAIFMTCFGWGKGIADKNVINVIRATLEAKDQKMLDSYYSCFGGGLTFVKRGHPDASELDGARKWAKKLVTAQNTICNLSL